MLAQSPRPLTLDQAEEIALRNHPKVNSAFLAALASNQVIQQTRSNLFPFFTGNMTDAGALEGTRLAAGGLNNPVIFTRFATGLTLNHPVWDFGRTKRLVESDRMHAQAQNDLVDATRAEVLLQLHQAYHSALRSGVVLRIAEQTVDARALVVDQVTALAESNLKSGLDVSFAGVNLAEARLLLVSAQDERRAAMADLSMAMGLGRPEEFELAETPLPPALPSTDALIEQALSRRPELAHRRHESEAAWRFAEAENALRLPSATVLGSVGVTPYRDPNLRGRFAAIGVNVSIPIFNGRLFEARRAEAQFKARAASERIRELEHQVVRDVTVSWYRANISRNRLDLTAQLLEQARQALELAQARYDLGLSSIVELSQAQLNLTSAELQHASARYEYQIQYAVLEFHAGALH